MGRELAVTFDLKVQRGLTSVGAASILKGLSDNVSALPPASHPIINDRSVGSLTHDRPPSALMTSRRHLMDHRREDLLPVRIDTAQMNLTARSRLTAPPAPTGSNWTASLNPEIKVRPLI